MKVKKTFNNNVLLAESDHQEFIVLGAGVAFHKHSGDDVDQSKIEKIFMASKFSHFNGFLDLINAIPEIYFNISAEIMLEAEKRLNTKFDSSVLIALIDHIHFSVQRQEQGIIIKNNLLWQIEKIYPVEYQIGYDALKIIKTATGVTLPQDEAGFIGLKFIEGATDNHSDVNKNLKITSDILNIIQYRMSRPIDDKSVSYRRLITHLNFLLVRIYDTDKSAGNSDDNIELLTTISNSYPKAFEIAKKVQIYIQQQLNVTVSANELTFLTIHIQRVMKENIS
ncbi:PRD domain-containing protein [Companilactobacillus huachuanensis]|uniref:PRD domain-containing protein n=1 Tax=Companilactobacillus huachuanensis TaxID=2559914 RepID=A0ABW1RQQ5_9LACO|nr:PRD domain-containing protein [Companilactobacillus huachuanensis]